MFEVALCVELSQMRCWNNNDDDDNDDKGKVHPITCCEGPEGEYRYSCLTTALDGVGGQHHTPAVLRRGRDPVPIVQEAGWAAPPQQFDLRTAQRVDAITALKIQCQRHMVSPI